MDDTENESSWFYMPCVNILLMRHELILKVQQYKGLPLKDSILFNNVFLMLTKRTNVEELISNHKW